MRRILHTSICIALAATVVAGVMAAPVPDPALATTGIVDFDATPMRLAGADRFATSVAIAAEAFPDWTGVDHVVVASGDRGIPDALTASGLCWAYDAPLLLISTYSTPASVRTALQQITAANPGVTVHVVGGEAPIPSARVNEIRSIIGGDRVTRVWGPDRFATAKAVAYRMRDVAASTGRDLPDFVFLANGADDAHVVDALVLSTMSASTGAPLLLLTRDGVPQATIDGLRTLGASKRYVAGGSAVVSERVVGMLSGVRMGGVDRTATSANIARTALSQGWVTTSTVAVAVGVPDALSGAGLMGRTHGALVLAERRNIPATTASYLSSLPTGSQAYVLGGTSVVEDSVVQQLMGAPSVPIVTSVPELAGVCAAKIPITVESGINTERLSVYVNGQLLTEQDATPFQTISLGYVAASPGLNIVRVVATGSEGRQTEELRKLQKLPYSWDTYIVIDKSEFRLYFVKGGVLDSVYPVAHGRNNYTPVRTWRIDAKYYTSPTSVYGPRKMRLYAQVGPGRFTYTPYLIHGTNQPWVIGTMASAGCIRMYNEDVLKLFPKVPLHTMVVTRP